DRLGVVVVPSLAGAFDAVRHRTALAFGRRTADPPAVPLALVVDDHVVPRRCLPRQSSSRSQKGPYPACLAACNASAAHDFPASLSSPKVSRLPSLTRWLRWKKSRHNADSTTAHRVIWLT